MSKLNVKKQKAIVRKINEISDLMEDICELYDELQRECDESGHDGYAEVEEWFSNEFPDGISDSFDELPWEFAIWAEELDERSE